MSNRTKTAITADACIKRINRRLAHTGERLCTSRSSGEKSNLGSRYILDTYRNSPVRYPIEDLEDLGRELGVLAPNEKVAA